LNGIDTIRDNSHSKKQSKHKSRKRAISESSDESKSESTTEPPAKRRKNPYSININLGGLDQLMKPLLQAQGQQSSTSEHARHPAKRSAEHTNHDADESIEVDYPSITTFMKTMQDKWDRGKSTRSPHRSIKERDFITLGETMITAGHYSIHDLFLTIEESTYTKLAPTDYIIYALLNNSAVKSLHLQEADLPDKPAFTSMIAALRKAIKKAEGHM
jgi:hypothetical protein